METKDGTQISAKDLFRLIPDDLVERLSEDYSVDRHARAFSGLLFLKLLILGMVMFKDEQSQTNLSKLYETKLFRDLNNLSRQKRATHQSISLRLKKIPPEYFESCYNAVLGIYAGHLRGARVDGIHLIAVDSTMVSEASARLRRGMDIGHGRPRQVKFTMAYDGAVVSQARLHTLQQHLDEDVPLSEAIMDNVCASGSVRDLYIFDRGIKGGAILADFAREDIRFVGRFNNNRRVKVIRHSDAPVGTLNPGVSLISDQIVYIYGKDDRNHPIPTPLRLVIVDMGKPIGVRGGSKASGQIMKLITDEMELSVAELLEIYRYRWSIEVFFKFLKSNLGFSHLLSVDENGMQCMLWITLITSLLLNIYASINHRSASTALLHFRLELIDDIIDMAHHASCPEAYLKGKLPDIRQFTHRKK